MSGFGFTQMMGGGGGSNIVTFGTGGDYADIGALIDASLTDTYARNTDTGRLYLTDSGGYPIGADAAALGALTLRAEIVGTEASAAAALNVAEDQGGSGTITWTGTHVALVSTAAGSDNAAVELADGLVTTQGYLAGFAKLVSVGSNANVGYRLTNVAWRDGSWAINMVLREDGDGAVLLAGSVIEAATSLSDAGLSEGGAFEWFEILRTDDSVLVWIDHVLAAGGNVTELGAINANQSVIIGDSWSSGDAGEMHLKNVRMWTIA